MADGSLPFGSAPRILDEAAARAYLGGKVNPWKVMPPVRIGGRLCWDRVALDQKLNELFGVAPAEPAGKESALDRWRRMKRGGANAA